METTTYCTFSSYAEFPERVCKLHWFSYKHCHALKYKHSLLININLETKAIMHGLYGLNVACSVVPLIVCPAASTTTVVQRLHVHVLENQ